MSHFFGLRTLKTSISVFLCVVSALYLKSQFPLFVAISAIVSTGKTIKGSIQIGKQRMIGTLFGALIGLVFSLAIPVLHGRNPILVGILASIGTIIIIGFCNIFHLSSAISMSCIVFCAIILTNSNAPFEYSFSRITDTFLGLLITFVVNVSIKPYNNIDKIKESIQSIQQSMLLDMCEVLAEARVSNILDIESEIIKLESEIRIYEHELFKKGERKSECTYLNGALQLLKKMLSDLSSINSLNVLPLLTQKNLEALKKIGGIELEFHLAEDENKREVIVLNYHLERLILANEYLNDIEVI